MLSNPSTICLNEGPQKDHQANIHSTKFGFKHMFPLGVWVLFIEEPLHQARPILTLYEPVVKACSKRVLSSIFLYFLRSSYMQPCGWNCPRAKGQGAKKKVCFAHRILDFHFFSLFLFCSWFYMMSPSMWPLRFEWEVFYFFQEIIQGP
jgi:hypothetical protein